VSPSAPPTSSKIRKRQRSSCEEDHPKRYEEKIRNWPLKIAEAIGRAGEFVRKSNCKHRGEGSPEC